MIDQHAACEKILYMEKYEEMKRVREGRDVKEKTTYQVPNLYRDVLRENDKGVNELGWWFKVGARKGTTFEI
jgi:hypothetical protein